MAEKVLSIQSLKKSIWRLFISQIEDDCRYCTQRRESYSSDTGYSAQVNFNWTCVVREMVNSNSFILDMLLSANTNSKKQRNSNHYRDIIPEYGPIYGILMKRIRFKDLSQTQSFGQ